MTPETLRTLLGWSALLNLVVLLYWFCAFVFLRDRIYRLHSRWFRLTPERFDAIHYSGMACYKIAIFLLHLGPYLALVIIE